jgi:hypothetical protein
MVRLLNGSFEHLHVYVAPHVDDANINMNGSFPSASNEYDSTKDLMRFVEYIYIACDGKMIIDERKRKDAILLLGHLVWEVPYLFNIGTT